MKLTRYCRRRLEKRGIPASLASLCYHRGSYIGCRYEKGEVRYRRWLRIGDKAIIVVYNDEDEVVTAYYDRRKRD